LASGLEIASQTDKIYEEDGNLSRFRVYLLYKVTFELWSYQHQAILEHIQINKGNALPNYYERFLRHRNIIINMCDDLKTLESISEPTELRNHRLTTWRTTIQDIREFIDIPRVGVKNRKGFNPWLISPQTKYVIFSSFLLVLGIIIATMLLIRR
jgi:hypothetical protein